MMDTKICKDCQVEQPIENFTLDGTGRPRTYCQSCTHTDFVAAEKRSQKRAIAERSDPTLKARRLRAIEDRYMRLA